MHYQFYADVRSNIKSLIQQINSSTGIWADPDIALYRENAKKAALSKGRRKEEVAKVDNLFFSIDSYPYPVNLRIYTPFGMDLVKNAPAFIYFRGSGFVISEFEAHDTLCRALANASNCKVIAVGCRVAPENPYPDGLNDCYAATKWIVENSISMGIDQNRIAIGGSSSGGNFSVTIAHRLYDEKKIKLAHMILMVPWLDLTCSSMSYQEYGRGYIMETSLIDWFVRQYVPQMYRINLASPSMSPYFDIVTPEWCPPTLIITAQYDPLRGDGEGFRDNLKKAGVDVEYSCYKGQIHHTLFAWFGVDIEAPDPVREIGQVLRKKFSESNSISTTAGTVSSPQKSEGLDQNGVQTQEQYTLQQKSGL